MTPTGQDGEGLVCPSCNHPWTDHDVVRSIGSCAYEEPPDACWCQCLKPVVTPDIAADVERRVRGGCAEELLSLRLWCAQNGKDFIALSGVLAADWSAPADDEERQR